MNTIFLIVSPIYILVTFNFAQGVYITVLLNSSSSIRFRTSWFHQRNGPGSTVCCTCTRGVKQRCSIGVHHLGGWVAVGKWRIWNIAGKKGGNRRTIGALTDFKLVVTRSSSIWAAIVHGCLWIANLIVPQYLCRKSGSCTHCNAG